MNKGIFLTIVTLLILINFLILSVFLLNKNNKIELPNLDNNVQLDELYFTEGTYYEVKKRDIIKSIPFNSTINTTEDSYIIEYEVDDTDFKLGEIIHIGTKLNNIGEDIYSTVHGRIINIESVNNKKIIYIINSDSFYVTINLPQELIQAINYESDIKAVVNNNTFNASILYIDYSLTMEGFKVTIKINDENCLLVKDLNVQIKIIEREVKDVLSIDIKAFDLSNNSNTRKVIVVNNKNGEMIFEYKFIEILFIGDKLVQISNITENTNIFVPKGIN